MSTLAVACGVLPPPTPTARHRSPVVLQPDDAVQSFNWSADPPVTFEQKRSFDRAPMEILGSEPAGAGTTGAKRMAVSLPTIGHDCVLKAKPFPPSLDGWNNSPRKELAAYAIQQLFLDPVDYVVPTTLPRCVPTELWNQHHRPRKATVRGTDCVLMVWALWLKNVEVPDRIYDERRFLHDDAYAYYISNFNVLTYLIDHRDGRRGNILVSTDHARPRLFAVDNGISFDPLVYNYFVANWNALRIPAIRRPSIERLRTLRRSDLDRLAVVAQMEAEPDGILRLVPSGPVLDPDAGSSVRDGVVQLGLTRKEIDDVWDRIERLVDRVDAGEIGVF